MRPFLLDSPSNGLLEAADPLDEIRGTIAAALPGRSLAGGSVVLTRVRGAVRGDLLCHAAKAAPGGQDGPVMAATLAEALRTVPGLADVLVRPDGSLALTLTDELLARIVGTAVRLAVSAPTHAPAVPDVVPDRDDAAAWRAWRASCLDDAVERARAMVASRGTSSVGAMPAPTTTPLAMVGSVIPDAGFGGDGAVDARLLAESARFSLLSVPGERPVRLAAACGRLSSRDPLFGPRHVFARCSSVRRHHAGMVTPVAPTYRGSERRLVTALAGWFTASSLAIVRSEPHRIAMFLRDLAGEFDLMWHDAAEGATMRADRPGDQAGTAARLGAIGAAGAMIRTGLRVLGIESAEELR
ncbi:DALR anticodon-binding domain-containing protein [Rhizosaccharibacter radicis]|uniref:DALR anticodon-binding domain-containing protein n=1 Tax=Rhizosaccharibacter radicis TaxID=2782605 RepID=A0ABT1VW89_9PROT|nr:DALR anticodon-binding domain-containing protein [Acetobacteraceae bacterium KSS12]